MHRNDRLIFVAEMTDWRPQEIHSFALAVLVRAPLVRLLAALGARALDFKSQGNYLLLVFCSGNKSEWKLECVKCVSLESWTRNSPETL